MKQSELSIWLKAIVVVAAILVLFFSLVLMPVVAGNLAFEYPEFAFLRLPGLISFWATMVPILYSLIVAWQIFDEIQHDNSFCPENAHRLRSISRIALMEVFLYFGALIVLSVYGALNPSVMIIMSLIIFVALSVAIATAALSHLVDKAVALKENDDLTV